MSKETRKRLAAALLGAILVLAAIPVAIALLRIAENAIK